MSAAAAPTLDAGIPVPPKKGKKKLIIIVAALLLLLLLAGGAAVVYLKNKAANEALAAEEGDAPATGAQHAAKPDLKHPPIFLPLDPFVVNLADRDADRYAQIGITLEVEDAKFAEQMKAFMPAIRNGILMILAHKSSRELLERSGKEELAEQVLLETARTMGVEIATATPTASKDDPDGGEDEPVRAKKKTKTKVAKPPAEPNPIRRVHFSNFIVQ